MSTSIPLCEQFDVGLFDLDGVVYAGDLPIPHAAATIAQVRRSGMHAAYVTNNASRTPQEVADKLGRVGVVAEEQDVITSAQVAADVLRSALAPGARVLVVGDRGLREAVAAAGLEVVESAQDDPAAVVQGHSVHTGWQQLAEATVAVRAGAYWVAANMDATIPTERGILAGNGSMVALVGNVLGRMPDAVAGKPEQTMHLASVARTSAQRPLVIGDRLDTDIQGATAARCASLYVMTGVSRPVDVVAAAPVQRPTYVASDLRGLLQPGRGITDAASTGRSGRWVSTPEGIRSDGAAGVDDAADLLALVCAVAWSGRVARPADDAARQVADALGLTS